MPHRFTIQHGDQHGTRHAYCVWDTERKHVVFANGSKSTVIAHAQACNGWPVNGSEQSFGLQAKIHDQIEARERHAIPKEPRMPNPAVTIRHARSAIRMVMLGAIAQIENAAGFADDDVSQDRMKDATRQLHDEALEALAEFEFSGTKLDNLEAMLDAMQAMLGAGPNEHIEVRELLAEFHLEP